MNINDQQQIIMSCNITHDLSRIFVKCDTGVIWVRFKVILWDYDMRDPCNLTRIVFLIRLWHWFVFQKNERWRHIETLIHPFLQSVCDTNACLSPSVTSPMKKLRVLDQKIKLLSFAWFLYIFFNFHLNFSLMLLYTFNIKFYFRFKFLLFSFCY